MTEKWPSVSIVIVTWNSSDVIVECLESIRQQQYSAPVDVIVWDNASTDDLASVIAPFQSDIRLVTSESNLGFSRANNAAARSATGEFLCFLNPDTVLCRDDTLARWVEELYRDPSAGLCAPRLLNPDGSIQGSIWRFTTLRSAIAVASGWELLAKRHPGFARRAAAPPEVSGYVDWVKGAAVLIHRTTFERVGGWDQSTFMYGEDQELCWAIRALGLRVRYTVRSEVLHYDDHAALQRWTPAQKAERTALAEAAFVRRHQRNGRGGAILMLQAAGYAWRAALHSLAGDAGRGSLYRGMMMGVVRGGLGNAAVARRLRAVE
jgi:GT2 family glycosyltransferase